jgi:hypothetical protein
VSGSQTLSTLIPPPTRKDEHRTTFTGSEINQEQLTKDLVALIESCIQTPPTKNEADPSQQPRP